MKHVKRGTTVVLSSMMVFSLISSACSKTDDKPAPQASGSTSPQASGSTSPSSTPTPSPKAEVVKIKVSLWDRGNQPQGSATLKENVMYKWINEQLKPLGVEVDYLQIPRAEAESKLNVLMAAGDAPDLIINYDAPVMMRYADQGGLMELDKLLDQYGPNIKKNNEAALAAAGKYKGVRYGIPAVRADVGGVNMSIRKDWLDKLNMKVPTTIDELTAALRAFKEQDPGGVGKDKVVPYALGSLAGGQLSFFYSPMYAFGVNGDGAGPEGMYMPSGTYKDGVFNSGFATPEGKAFFKWFNGLYQEGLIPKEFATDLNSAQLNQDYAKGNVGFIDGNNPAPAHTNSVRKTSGNPAVSYVTVPPLLRPDGSQYFSPNAMYGMYMMIPKKTPEKNAIAVMKYLNWMAQPEIIEQLNYGIEGVHWKRVDGVRTAIDADKNKQDLWIFGSGDLEIVQQGVRPAQTLDALMKENSANPDLKDPAKLKEWAEGMIAYRAMVTKFIKPTPILDMPRPVNDKIGKNIGTTLVTSVSKVIMAKDFEKEYSTMVSAWEALGGRDWDKEVAAAVKQSLGK